MYVRIHCGWGAHVSRQVAPRFVPKFRLWESTVTASSAPLNNRLLATNGRMDTRRNLYVLGLPFDLVKYASSTVRCPPPLLTA